MTTSKAASLTTEEAMQVALDLSGLADIPSDTGVHVRADSVHRVFATIDCEVADLLMARVLRCDTVLTHHPEGAASLHGWKLITRQIEQMVECGVGGQGRGRHPAANAVSGAERPRPELRPRGAGAQLLNVAFLNVHLPCDVITRRLILEKMAPSTGRGRATVAEVVAAFRSSRTELAATSLRSASGPRIARPAG
jgi:hypothetical protein